ncbi:unnamed protein product [Umbelopsis ramanniana]
MEPPKEYTDIKGMAVTPTTSWPKSPMPCQDTQVRVVVSDRDRALITGLGPTGMYTALFSSASGAKVSRWEFDEDHC